MKQVADAAGTSIAQLYLSFPSKQMLLGAVYEQCAHRLLDGFLKPAMYAPGDDWTRITRAIHAYTDFFVEEPQLAQLMMFTSLTDLDHDDPTIQAMLRDQAESMGEIFRVLGAATEGSETNPEYHVRWVWAAVYGLAAQRMRLPHLAVSEDEFRMVIESGIKLHRDGLSAQRERVASGAAE